MTYLVNYFVEEEVKEAIFDLHITATITKQKTKRLYRLKIVSSTDFPTLSLCLQEVEKDLQTKREGISEAIRSVEELLADKGESLSPEERANLEGALTRMKAQYSALTDSVNTSLSEVHTAIDTTLQQNTQKVLVFFFKRTILNNFSM